jgi:hypothetical protein
MDQPRAKLGARQTNPKLLGEGLAIPPYGRMREFLRNEPNFVLKGCHANGNTRNPPTESASRQPDRRYARDQIAGNGACSKRDESMVGSRECVKRRGLTDQGRPKLRARRTNPKSSCIEDDERDRRRNRWG